MTTLDATGAPAVGSPEVPDGPVLRSQPGRRRSSRRVAVAGAVVVAAIGFLVFKGVTSAFVYFKTADQALADRASLGNSTFQIEGTVVKGSLRPTANPSTFSFRIASGSARVFVENTGAPPQLFGAGVPVVLVGHFVGRSDTFASDQILVKHSSTYIAAHPNRVRSSNGALH
jgi:cytochrome c-type biogenesis protein CcmE